MSTSPVTPTPPAGGTTPPTTNGLPTGQSLNNMFLQLLVAQLQNQDPTSPVDPSQFVGQLAQFSELSEVTSIYTLLQGFVPASGGSGGSGSSGSGSSVSGASSSNGANPAAASLLAPLAMAPASLAAVSSPALSAASSAANPVSKFASPTLSALTSKIQGAF